MEGGYNVLLGGFNPEVAQTHVDNADTDLKYKTWGHNIFLDMQVSLAPGSGAPAMPVRKSVGACIEIWRFFFEGEGML